MGKTVMKEKAEEFVYDRRVRNLGFDMSGSHYHTHFELYYLMSGHSRLFINHTLHDVEPGTAILIKPMEIHRSAYHSMPVNERVTITFSREYLKELEQFCGEGEAGLLLERHKYLVPANRRPSLEELLRKLEYEGASGDIYSKLLRKNHLYELLILLNRCQEAGMPKKIEGAEGVIEEAAQYLYHNYDRQISLEEISGIAHMSPSYFSRKFKKVTGFGFKEYLNHVRINRACKMLLEGNESVTEIATRCGFSDGNYFGDVFRREKGVSPNRYRKIPT